MPVVCHEAKCSRSWNDMPYAVPTVRYRFVKDCENGRESYFLFQSVVLPCEQHDDPEILEFCYPVEIYPGDRENELICQIRLRWNYKNIGFAPPPASDRYGFSRLRATEIRTDRQYQCYLADEPRTWQYMLLRWLARVTIIDTRLRVAVCFAKHGVLVDTTDILKGWGT